MPIWNSVDKLLPQHSRLILAYAEDYESTFYLDEYDKEFGWMESKLLGIEPTHWMELPKPPIK